MQTRIISRMHLPGKPQMIILIILFTQALKLHVASIVNVVSSTASLNIPVLVVQYYYEHFS